MNCCCALRCVSEQKNEFDFLQKFDFWKLFENCFAIFLPNFEGQAASCLLPLILLPNPHLGIQNVKHFLRGSFKITKVAKFLFASSKYSFGTCIKSYWGEKKKFGTKIISEI